MADLPEPKSRKEEYLATAAGMTGIELPEPASREEIYLDAIAQGGGGGGGSSVNVVQTTGTSITDVMSQKAVTDELYHSNSKGKVQIGASADSGSDGNSSSIAIGTGSKAKNSNTIAIGTNASSLSSDTICLGRDSSSTVAYNSVAIGRLSSVTAMNAVAVGTHASATQQGQFDISTGDASWGYNNSAYRLLTGLYDPQNAHDAATKGYVDGLVGDVSAALNAINNGTGA